MARQAAALGELRAVYDAVVIGTGYGGGVAACRLARAGLRVAVLERGREFEPGDFPESALDAAKELQVQLGTRRLGKASGLFDFRASDDVVALVGCGVGGTSLINANVSLVPDDDIFDDERWPMPLRRPGGDFELRTAYDRARAMLRPMRYPEDRLDHVEQPPVVVAFADVDGDRDALLALERAQPRIVTSRSAALDREVDRRILLDGGDHLGERVEPAFDRNVVLHLVEDRPAFARQ